MAELEFIETDARTIYNDIMAQLEASVDEPLYPGDERRIFAEALVPLFVGMYNSINDAARQVMLRYARGAVLDALGERVAVERIPPEPANTTLRFSLNAAIGQNIIIPAGTRATSDNARYFATTSTAVIQAGSLYVDTPAKSTAGGEIYNGIGAGSISTLVDLIAYVDTVANTTETAGGANEEIDESLRERIRVAPSKLSTAGTIQGYRYFAMSADASITDVTVKTGTLALTRTLNVASRKAYKGGTSFKLDTLAVYPHGGTTAATLGTDYTATYTDDLLIITVTLDGTLALASSIDITIESDAPGVVKLVPICGGELPTQAILDKVVAACNASTVRPLTDMVTASAPNVEQYDIVLTYYTTAEQESECISTIEGAGGAIEQYIAWQSATLNRDINPDKLRALILAPSSGIGAIRVAITSPTFVQLDDITLAQHSGTITVTHEVTTE